MLRRLQLNLLVLTVLSLALAACGPANSTPTPAGAVGQVTASPKATPTSAPGTPTPAGETSTAPTQGPDSTPAPTSPATPLPPTVPPTAVLTSTPTDTPTVDPLAEPPELAFVRVVDGLAQPVGMAHAGDGTGRLFILEKVGRIRVVQNGALLDGPFLDLRDRVGSSASEQGLLGLAFHPRYSDNGLFFVNYTDRQGDTVVSRFSVSSDPNRGDAATEAVILTVDQPAGNHNGGHLAFGPDGMLYIGLGDGGGAGDRYGNGQNPQALLGKMLRIDVDGGDPYAVPADNPFAGDSRVRGEIWATGLRNPWRYSFDRVTGDLYIADVGQNQWEEVNVQPASSVGGENYGWPIMEGLHCFRQANCDPSGLILPIAEYSHDEGCSITGGYVYRGQQFPALAGVYLFGDYCSGRVWGLATAADRSWRMVQLAATETRLTSFGEDEAGEVYLVDARGALYQIQAQFAAD